jgi:drug/metabolite transporter (DMT)-like permease
MKLFHYLSQLSIYYWFLFSLITVAVSDIFSKNFAIKQTLGWYFAIVGCGILGSTIWAAIMLSSNQLIRATFIWTVLASLVSIGVGLVFKETLTITQWVGVALALISLGLLA